MKKIIALFLVVFLPVILCVSCTKESEQPVSSSLQQSSKASRHFIGQRFEGGIIFWLDSNGTHGLIAATQDLEEPAIWAFKDTLTRAGGTRIGTGARNTMRIFKTLEDPHDESLDYAALECSEFKDNGYRDWYLPSKNELNELYKQRNVIGGFNPFAYWSSTEINDSTAWFQNFSNGLQVKSQKLAAYAIRPIRYF